MQTAAGSSQKNHWSVGIVSACAERRSASSQALRRLPDFERSGGTPQPSNRASRRKKNAMLSLPKLKPDRPEIERAIALLFERGSVVEARIPKTRAGTVSGYFDDHTKLAAAIEGADAKYGASGIYFVLNPTWPALLARACNRLREHAELTTADNHILWRRWLPVDLDPVRPAGISSSDEEHAAAIDRARIILHEMAAEWGGGVLADSGNGAHLLYEIDLPNNQEGLAFVSGALAELDRRYSDNVVKVDVTSSNAARIWKAYGTVARKGDSIPGRPHRLSRILEIPK